MRSRPRTPRSQADAERETQRIDDAVKVAELQIKNKELGIKKDQVKKNANSNKKS